MIDDIKNIKRELEMIESEKEKSFAMELVEDERKSAKRFFIIWVITFTAFICLMIYTMYLLNDISRIETVQEIEDVNTINGNVVNDGDIYGEN